MWSVLKERSDKSLAPLRVGLTAGSRSSTAALHLSISLTAAILYRLLTHIALAKDVHRFTRIQKHTSPLFLKNVLLCEKERLLNQGLPRWVVLNYANKQSPFVKSAFSQFVCISTISSLSRPSCFSSWSPSSPHHSPLFSLLPLVLWQQFLVLPK